MKKLIFACLVLLAGCSKAPQTYPFQDPTLYDEERLDNLISLMTLEEKVNCLSARLSIPRLGVKGTRIVEGLHGLALSGPANWAVKGKGASATTTFPQAIGLAQMWDPDMIQRIARQEAYECRYLTQSPKYSSAGLIVLSPNADLGRDVRWGRTEECYGEDAFLTASLVTAFVKGLQGDHPQYWMTSSLMKHFLANSNENNRTFNSSDFDDQLYREYYSYPFYKGVTEGGSRAYMAAYNKVNGIPCTVHPMLKEITVKEWGQNGIICTDGGAFSLLVTAHKYYPDLTQAAAACIKSGITMFLDNYKQSVNDALAANLINEKDVEQAIRGSLRVLLKLGLLDSSGSNPYSKIGITDTLDPWTLPETHLLARIVTSRSVVLLKNEKEILPLRKDRIKKIAVIGPLANKVISDWYAGTPPYRVSVLDGIRNNAGQDIQILFAESNKADSAVIAAREADIAIVCMGNHPLSYGLGWGQNHVPSDGREEVDRQALSLEQEDLLKLVYAANPNTVLVLISSFPYTINWSKENIPAIVHISHSSQELGNGLADVLFGNVNPAGRLVQTWPASIEHLPPILDYNIRNGRTYMYNRYEPLFPFGFGLSYTTFKYSPSGKEVPLLRPGETVEVVFNLTNTGNYDGDEVCQLYVSFPGSTQNRPPVALKGFKRVFVPKGQTVEVRIPLRADDLKYWDTHKKSFVLETGDVSYYIGGCSNDKRLTGSVKVVQ